MVLAQAFLLVTAPFFIKEAQSYQFLIIVYMIMTVSFRVFGGKSLFTGQGAGLSLMWFSVGLVGTALVLAGGEGLAGLLQTFQLSSNAPIWIGLTQALVIASSEEVVFRGQLPKIVGVIPAQIAFGFFHLAAYGLQPISIIFAVGAGFVFYFAAKFTNNLATAIGIHTAWNLYAIGILQMVVA